YSSDAHSVVLSRYGTVDVFFFHATSPPDPSTLSLHDALPISRRRIERRRSVHRDHGGRVWDVAWTAPWRLGPLRRPVAKARHRPDRKSTRLNSSHVKISYAVFCLKKKKTKFTSDMPEDRLTSS